MIIGIAKNQLLICLWKNFLIKNPNEIATKFTIKDLNSKTIHKYEFSETVRPYICKKDNLQFIDNYPNSPERLYLLENDKLQEITNQSTIEKESNIIPNINFPENFEMVSYPVEIVLEFDKKIIVKDQINNLWLYEYK